MATEIVRVLEDGIWKTEVGTGGGAGGGISEITSTDMSVTITDPTGPTVDLSASGGSNPITVATATLTNAQILALPTTAVELVAAPTAGTVRLVLWAALVLDTSTADYADIDVAAYIVVTGGGETAKLAEYSEDGVSSFLAQGGLAHVVMYPRVGINLDESDFPLASPRFNGDDAISIVAANGAVGDFTGGDASQSMKVRVAYIDITL